MVSPWPVGAAWGARGVQETGEDRTLRLGGAGTWKYLGPEQGCLNYLSFPVK